MLFPRARPGTIEAVVRDLASHDVEARLEAVAATSTLDLGAPEGRRRVIDALVRSLRDDGAPRVRAAAALALADLGADDVVPALVEASDDGESLVRQLAIAALGELATSQADARVVDRVRRALTDSDAEVRFQAIVAYPRLVAAAVSSRTVGAEAAIDLEGAIDEAWRALDRGLRDDDPQVRGRAAEACAELAKGASLSRSIADRLAAIVAADRETPDARVAASIALAESGDDRGREVIVAVVDRRIDEPDPGRIQACFELAGERGYREVIDAATSAAFGVRAFFASDPGTRTAALVALARLGDRRAIDAVLADLSPRVSFGRRAVAIGISARAAIVEARPLLEALVDAPSLADPEAVHDALASLDVERSTA